MFPLTHTHTHFTVRTGIRVQRAALHPATQILVLVADVRRLGGGRRYCVAHVLGECADNGRQSIEGGHIQVTVRQSAE